jgi:hypothetical protein
MLVAATVAQVGAGARSLDKVKVALMRKQLHGRDMLERDRVMRRIGNAGIACPVIMNGGKQCVHA